MTFDFVRFFHIWGFFDTPVKQVKRGVERMIHIRLAENYVSVHKEYPDKYVMDLRDVASVEHEYRHIIEWHSKAFKDEMSLKIMDAIDGAKRVGAYGVRTPIGKSCITCLSSGCKFALLLWYFRENDHIVIVTDFGRGGNNVWEFIAENFDCNLFMCKEEFHVPHDFNVPITIDGVFYSKEVGGNGIWDLLWRVQEEPYEITKEKELKAYHKYIEQTATEYIYRPLKEELSIGDFIAAFETEGVSVSEDYLKLDYTIVNCLSAVKDDLGWRRLPIWFLYQKDADYKLCNSVSVKFPHFIEIILYDVVNCDACEDADTYFALVLDGEGAERCKIAQYPFKTQYGVLVEKKEKRITILDKDAAVKKFHALYILTQDGNDTFD